MVKLEWVLIAALAVAGCGQRGNIAGSVGQTKSDAAVTSFLGPGGSVGIGDSLDQAKKAFPAPSGAQTFDSALSFAILTHEGWAWASADGKEAFEAAAKNGKIVALARTGGDASGEPDKTIDRLGPPTRKAAGKTATMLVWEAGPNARFYLDLNSASGVLGVGKLALIGNKDDLKLLNYRAEDPESFVKQMDAAAEAMNSPEMKKAFEDAKQRALQKKKK